MQPQDLEDTMSEARSEGGRTLHLKQLHGTSIMSHISISRPSRALCNLVQKKGQTSSNVLVIVSPRLMEDAPSHLGQTLGIQV